MSIYMTQPPVVAGGNINGRAFIKPSTSADQTVLQAGLNDVTIGITPGGQHDFPVVGQNPGPLYTSGLGVHYYAPGSVAPILAGTGGFTRGDYLMSDANGAGIPGVPLRNNIGARALQSAAAGKYGLVQVLEMPATTLGTAAFATRVVTASGNLTIADVGVTVMANAAGTLTLTLPPVATLVARQSFTIYTLQVPASGNGTSILINAADTATVTVYGDGYAGVAGHGFKNTQATSRIGDKLTVTFDGTNFFISDYLGTWTNL